MANTTSCLYCQATMKAGTARCMGCGRYNFTDTTIKDRRTILSQVKPDAIPRVTSGAWDPAFGGGIMTSSVTLLAGEPGAGKSTLLLQVCNAIAGIELSKLNQYKPYELRTVLYIGTEENEQQIKERADRLQLQHQDGILLVNAMGGMNLDTLLQETKPRFVVLDSLPGFTGKGTDKDEAIAVVKGLKHYAEKHHAPAIVTDHITKDLDFAGYMSLMHAVDCLLMFKIDLKNKDIRLLSAEKNRNGALKDVLFWMSEKGLINVKPGPKPRIDSENP